MFSCLRQTFILPKKILISNKSFSLQYFSGLSSIHGRISNKNYTCLKINKPNTIPKRSFSLQNIQAFYDSISSSEASQLVKKILVETHDFTGFSWTLTIMAASAILKLFIALPCAIYQRFLVSKMELTEIEMSGMLPNIQEKILKKAYAGKWTEKRLRLEYMFEVKNLRKMLIVKNNCHPFKAVILFFIQFPFWVLLSITIRRFAIDAHTGQSDYPAAAVQFQVGGPLWCRNLCLPDPTFIIPTINFLGMLISIELSFMSNIQETIAKHKVKSLVHKILPNFCRLLAVMFFFISAAVPSSLSLFWMTNTSFALAQNILILSPKVRRFFKIPKTPSEFDKPYSQVWNRFAQKFQMFSSKKY